jgi:hypothetical protein
MIDTYCEENPYDDFGDYKDLMMKLTTIKHKEMLRETLAENNRKGNFTRIFPAKGTDVYE